MLTHDDVDDNADDDHDDDDDHGDHDDDDASNELFQPFHKYGTRWRETTQVQQMRTFFNSIKPSEEAHKNPLRGKGLTDAQKVFQHYNW